MQVPLAREATCALRVLVALDALVGAGLVLVVTGAVPWTGPLSAVTTLGGHPTVTLVIAVTSLAALLSMAPVTGGLTRAAGPQITLISTGALLGLVAVGGAVAVVLASAAVMVAVARLLVAVVDRF